MTQSRRPLLGDRIRQPRDGRNGRDGRDGKDGRDGARGQKGEPGADGKDLSLVPALATFIRDDVTNLTLRVDVADLSGAALLSIVPNRDDEGLMTSAQIIPA